MANENQIDIENDARNEQMATLFITVLPQECWHSNSQNDTLSDPDQTTIIDSHLDQFSDAWRRLADV